MHTKLKGNIGETAVALCLQKMGYNVFRELGDYSKIDLIAEKDCSLIKIQVKCVAPKNNCISLELRKSGPNYKFIYSKDMVDYFAIYDILNDKVYFIKSSVLDTNKNLFKLRLSPAKNNNKKLVNLASDYLADIVLKSA